jgi:hypothetical protein
VRDVIKYLVGVLETPETGGRSFDIGGPGVLSREEQDRVHTRRSDAYPPAHELAMKLHEIPKPVRYTSSYSLLTGKGAPSLFRSICRIGGKEGWFYSNRMWRLRGMIDRILLGVGSSRGSPPGLCSYQRSDSSKSVYSSHVGGCQARVVSLVANLRGFRETTAEMGSSQTCGKDTPWDC